MLAGKVEKLGLGLARLMVIALTVTVLGLIGVFFVAFGLARWLESRFDMVAGTGLVCVGVGLICATLVCLLVVRGRNGG